MRKSLAVATLLFTVVLVLTMLAAPVQSAAQVAISVSFGPPAIPVYDQPICPGEGYIWTPGYWAWDPDEEDYYWVPGTWVLAPQVGYLWTPPWWGWENGVYLFHEGWWGPHVGFYGGVVYGFGYFGEGFEGGRWEGDRFYYNQSVTNVNVVNVRNVYNERVTVNTTNVNRVSYNGGPGGIQARPRPQDESAARERHIPPAAAQTQHFQEARRDPQLRASANHGRPPIAATEKPADFHGRAVPAREAGGTYNPPANRGRAGGNATRGENASRPVHPNDLPPLQRPGAPNTGNPNRDRKYQQQQDKMYNRQVQDRQKLQQRQEQEHQRYTQRNAPPPRMQQLEQRHQQQTQQMHEQHTQQQQRMQQKTQPPPERHR